MKPRKRQLVQITDSLHVVWTVIDFRVPKMGENFIHRSRAYSFDNDRYRNLDPVYADAISVGVMNTPMLTTDLKERHIVKKYAA